MKSTTGEGQPTVAAHVVDPYGIVDDLIKVVKVSGALLL
jgi:hypothetical protein